MAKRETPPPAVRVGQVWADNDSRDTGRRMAVRSTHARRSEAFPHTDKALPHAFARCEVVRWSDTLGQWVGSGRFTWLAIHRMRPTRSGYRLVQDAPNEE